jgi:CubicO group peptidase (beta-lactamase class C family)
MTGSFGASRTVLVRAVHARAFPAAVVEVGDREQARWREAFGHLTFEPDAPPTREDTIFDLASLTKVLCTAGLVMGQLEQGRLTLDDPVRTRIPGWQRTDRDRVTIRDLLAHCAGLPAYVPFFRVHTGRAAFEHAICETPLEYPPRSASVYSDLGFMLLGFLLEEVAPLPVQFDAMLQQMGTLQELRFQPPDAWRPRTAPTEQDSWRGRLLVGEVHDENAWALAGVAGHAGLFGTAAAVGQYARHLLQVLAGRVGAFRQNTVDTFIARRVDVPGSSRALGWDTMLPSSSCGRRLSPRAFGHTGFTGTSLWIDPQRDIYVVLLTNRVHPTRSNDAIREVRPALHDAVIEDLESMRDGP